VSGENPKLHYYLYNHRGDVLVVLNPDGAANSTFRYDAFGNYYQMTGPFAPRYTFSTKEYLSAAGLYLYQYRAYDPIAGRWTQRDPIDYQDSINLYQFCRNNPVSVLDEDGRVAQVVVVIVGVIIVAALILPSQVCQPTIDLSYNAESGGQHRNFFLRFLGFTSYNPGDNPLIAESVRIHEKTHMRDTKYLFAPRWWRERRAFRAQLKVLNKLIYDLASKEKRTDKEEADLKAARQHRDYIVEKKLDTKEGAKQYVKQIDAYAEQEKRN